jgi:hypothetical protein
MTDLDALERLTEGEWWCDSGPSNDDKPQFIALIAELRASRFVASVAREYVEWELAQPRSVTFNSGQQFRDALRGNLQSALAELEELK